MNGYNPSVQSQSAMPPSHNPSLPQHVTSPGSGAPQQNFQYTMSQMDGRQFYPPQPQQQPLLWNQWYDLIVILFFVVNKYNYMYMHCCKFNISWQCLQKIRTCIVFFLSFCSDLHIYDTVYRVIFAMWFFFCP